MITALSRAAIFMLTALSILATGALVACPERVCRVPEFDAMGLTIAHGSRSTWLDSAFMALTGLGSLFVLVPAIAWFAWRRSVGRPRTDAAFIALALAGAALIAHLAKLAIARPRPNLFPALIEMPTDSSLPSAHALQVTAVVAAWLLRPGRTTASSEVLTGGVLVAAVAYSRVYLQVHFPSDVMVGVATALAWVLALRCLPVWQKGHE